MWSSPGDQVPEGVVLAVAAVGLAAAGERPGQRLADGRLTGVLGGQPGRLWQRSGAPQVRIATGAPGLATRRSSRRAATGSAAYWTELNAVIASKACPANGSDSRSPRRRSAPGTRSRAMSSSGAHASNPV